MALIVCRPRSLPFEKLDAAARRAVEVNPDNAVEERRVARTPPGRRGGPRRIAVVVARKWPASGVRLSVSFLDDPSRELRSKILLHMNAWGESASVVFAETRGTGEVRIARLDSPADLAGYWSYVGTEILDVEPDQPTLNLEGFTVRTPEAEFRRVVRHEAGHTLGFEHEHMRSDIVRRIDRTKAFAYFDRDQGWTREEVEEQVLTPLEKKSLMGTTESDPLSIMCYQLPASIMKDRKPVPGGKDINPKDRAFAESLYPKEGAVPRAKAPEVAAPPLAAVPALAAPSGEDDTFDLVVMDEFRPDGARPDGRTPSVVPVFASYRGARVTSMLRLRAERTGGRSSRSSKTVRAANEDEERTNFGEIIRMHESIKNYTNRDEGSLPSDAEMIRFGGLLFDTLLQGNVRRLYDEARTRERSGHLDVVLTSMIPWISDKPWEFAYDPGRKSFLATEEIHFVRNVLTNVPADAVVRPSGPLRILVAAAQPVGFGRLSIDQEVEVIRRGFDALIEEGLVAVDVLPRATPARIHARISTGAYQVVHFIGHGLYDEQRREGCLVFENDRGGEVRLGERALREVFCRRGLSLVFLNACESGRGGRSDFNKGVAQSLVAHGLPALVANQYSVVDSSATSFAQHFYWSVAQGMSVGQAAREARIAVNYSLDGEVIDWAVPVVYARDPDMTLCAPRASRAPAREAAARAARRGTGDRESRVAVWDVDDVFPSLSKTLQAMNGAQDVFGFELVDTTVPLGVWELDRKEGKRYLWAERLAERLKSKAPELGADVLACVTRHWLRDDHTTDLYGWWPDGGSPPVVIFSIAGFDRLAAEGLATDRAFVNAMVSNLAGFYADAESHSSGAKDCPMFYNPRRVFKYLVDPQQFDAACRRKLARKLKGKLGALEALLKLFAPADAPA